MLCLKEAEQPHIKANHHNEQEHGEDKKGQYITFTAPPTPTSKETRPEIKKDKSEEEWRRGGVQWVRNKSSGQLK